MLSPKIFHLCQDRFGLNETYQELHKDPLFCILCDALYLPKPEEGARIAKDFERIIKKYLSIHRHNFSEKTLQKALEYAQKHFFKKYTEDQNLLKITAFILAEPPNSEKNESRYFYIAGLGDFKLFEIQRSATLLFYDPETPKLPVNLSLKKRFQYVTNAIGHPYIKSSIIKVCAHDLGPLLLMSYGTYSSLSEEKWLHYASDFENKKNQIIRSIAKSKDKDHRKHLVYISFKNPNQLKEEEISSFTKKKHKQIKALGLSKGVHFFQWIFKISLVCILGLCILELTHNYPLFSALTANSHEHFKNPIREPDMQLNLRSLKKPNRFPFIKERAFFVDMKKKQDRQAMIIEQLTLKLQDQDKLLRDLQIKTYYPTPFLSVENLIPEKESLQ